MAADSPQQAPAQPADTLSAKQLTLGTLPVGKLLMQYSVPAIIASLATSLYNIVDSIFIGRGVGAMAIAGLAVTFPLMNLVVAFCTLVAVGGATISSIFLGRKDLDRATDVVNNVTTLCLIHSVVFGGLTLLFLDPILYFFGATPETISYAREFMVIILYASPVSYIFIGLNNLMRATGYPTKAMISALLTVVVNIILAPIFIYSLGWGIAGAAWATVIGQGVGLVWVTYHFLSRSSVVHLQWRRRWLALRIIRKIYSIGLSPFLMNVCACIVVIFINKALLEAGGSAFGNLAIGAYGIINRTTMFFVMIVFGVTQGMQPILGFNVGAGQWARVKHTLWLGIRIGVIITTIGWAITQLMPNTVSSLFTTDRQLIDIARPGFHLFFLVYPLVGCQIVIQNYFQSIGQPKLSIFLALTRQLIMLIPFLIFLPRIMGIDGVWLSISLADSGAFILAIIILWIQIKKTNRRIKATPTPR